MSRRKLLLAGAAAPLALSGCGGGSAKEGEDVFSWDVKVLNLASTEQSVSLSSGGTTFMSNVPFGSIGTHRFVEDDTAFFADVEVTGASGVKARFTAFNVHPGLFVLTSSGTTDGTTTGYQIKPGGGVPGAYTFQGGGKAPNSQMLLVTGALSSARVKYMATATSTLVTAGNLSGDGALVNLPQAASPAFRLVLADSSTDQTLYDSGLRAKAADTLFVIARPGVRAAGWAVWAVDATYPPTRWASV